MRPYVPYKIIDAVLSVERQHPAINDIPLAISTDSLKELVLKINSKEMRELKAFSALLTRRESNALCHYLKNNVYNADLKKIAQVVYYCMNAVNFETTLNVWQQAPACYDALFVLGACDSPKYRNDKISIKHGLLKSWAQASRPLAAVTQTCIDLGSGKSFKEKFASLGLDAESNLAQLCYQQFFRRASLDQIAWEGDHKLWDVLSKSEKQTQEKILLHLLKFGESAEKRVLPLFHDTYQIAYSLWKEPSPTRFPEGHEEAFNTYSWWYKYKQLTSAFSRDADLRRINFWKRYLHKCSCSVYKKHSILVMDFGDYVITEFESIGPVYIFTSAYFKNIVMDKTRSFNNTTEFKSWLYHIAQYTDRQVHTPNSWELSQVRTLRRLNIV